MASQLLATIGMLGEDASGRGLWDIEDEGFAAAVERFANDLPGCAGAVHNPAEVEPLD